MVTTTYNDFTAGVRQIGARTDSAGTDVDDLPFEQDALINSILTEGFLASGAFEVSADSPASMDVIVGSGTAKADVYVVETDETGRHPYIVRLDDANVTITVPAADASNGRIDEVWLVVRDPGLSGDAGSLALPRLAYRKGDPDASPSAPGADSAWAASVKLATITVPAGATSIANEGDASAGQGEIADNRATSNLNGVLRDALVESLGGSGSGLDADTVDGVHAAALAKLAGATFTGQVTGTDVGFDPVVATDTHNNGAAPSAWPAGLALMIVSAASFWPTSAGLVVSVNRGATSGRAVQWFFERGTSRVHVRTSDASTDTWENWQLVTTQGDFSTWPVTEVDNSTEVGSQTLTTTMATVASVALTIPSDWGSWKCFAHATYAVRTAEPSGETFNTKIRIDGGDQQTQLGVHLEADVIHTQSGAVSGRRTGMTSTGSRTVALLASLDGGLGTTDMRNVCLYARAVRTS